jgi:uncharacterized protein GlcG (DUF336 family)
MAGWRMPQPWEEPMKKAFALLAAGEVALAISAVPAGAQTARPMLDYATAAKMRDACVAYAGDHKAGVAIAIYDDEGRLVAFALMDGIVNVSSELAMWKAKAAMNYRVPSAAMAKWDPAIPGVATFPGGVPFYTAQGAPLGAIGVSGSSPDGDLACARAAVAAAGLKEAPAQ